MSFSNVKSGDVTPFIIKLREAIDSILSPRNRVFKSIFSDVLRGDEAPQALKSFINEDPNADADYLADAYFERFDNDRPRPPFDGTMYNPENFERNLYLGAALKYAEETGMNPCIDEIRGDGQTDLHIAATGRAVTLEMMLASTLSFNPNRRDLTGKTPLDVAAEQLVNYVLSRSSEEIANISDPNSDEYDKYQNHQRKVDFLYEDPRTNIHARSSANTIVEKAIERHKSDPNLSDNLTLLETVSCNLEDIRKFYPSLSRANRPG
jgi:hypothetical protein